MPLDFHILKRSKRSRARLGILKTAHGEVQTPAFVGVATQASVKSLTSEEAERAGCQLLIVNNLHMHLKPGDGVVAAHGGLHRMMRWPRPLMTDSGGFQVFSLGFGRDHGMGKMLKARAKDGAAVRVGHTPKNVKITEDGVHFRSYIDGSKLFMGPRESMAAQKRLGADITFAFDECTSPIADEEYTRRAMERTHRWARMCLDVTLQKHQSLYGIVQGGKFKRLRIASARAIGAMPFDGFGIGGEFGDQKGTMTSMMRCVVNELPEGKPRHLLGIGHPEDIVRIVKEGADTFDCIVPTHYARHGTAFTSTGRLDLGKSAFLNDKKPLDSKCSCEVCAVYSRGYICHLYRLNEITAMRLLTFHNLHWFNAEVAKVRKLVAQGKL